MIGALTGGPVLIATGLVAAACASDFRDLSTILERREELCHVFYPVA